jgi:penicillin-insensitive murein DD-endopeptidase
VLLVATAVAAPELARADATPTPWSSFRSPTTRAPQAIGGYSAGCIDGAVALGARGEGFRVVRPERHRLFGHPELVALIRDLGHHLHQLKLAPLAVGDLAQPRGGPAPTGHASHQTGLDVDLWFAFVKNAALSMVDAARKQPSAKFGAREVRLLELTAADARVDRIFVNPVLKRALCERTPEGGDRAWLHKLRPWWGHDDHFHVRLTCPADSPACVAQPPLPPGDGCDKLDWWFDEKAQADREAGHQTYASKIGTAPELPEGCRALLDPAPAAATSTVPAATRD